MQREQQNDPLLSLLYQEGIMYETTQIKSVLSDIIKSDNTGKSLYQVIQAEGYKSLSKVRHCPVKFVKQRNI